MDITKVFVNSYSQQHFLGGKTWAQIVSYLTNRKLNSRWETIIVNTQHTAFFWRIRYNFLKVARNFVNFCKRQHNKGLQGVIALQSFKMLTFLKEMLYNPYSIRDCGMCHFWKRNHFSNISWLTKPSVHKAFADIIFSYLLMSGF